MDHGEELGHLLDLVDHDLPHLRVRRYELGETLRPRGVAAHRLRIEEVQDQGLGKGRARPQRFSGPARSEKEEAAASGGHEEPGHELHYEAHNGGSTS